MDLIAQLKRDEALVLHAYQDSEGYWTIGYGTLIDKRVGGGITREEAEYLLANRISGAKLAVGQTFPWSTKLDPARLGVLHNMTFNMGVRRLQGFKKFLAALEAGDYPLAATEMLDSKWAKQVGVRADRLVKQVISGEWQ